MIVELSLILLIPITITAISQMIVVKKKWFQRLAIPIDFGIKFRGNYIFGQTKTWRGILFMIFSTSILTVIIFPLFPTFCEVSCKWETDMILGFLLGLGYSLGELPNSFIKRRLSVPSGNVPENKFWRGLVVFIDSFDSSIGTTAIILVTGIFKVDYILELAISATLIGGFFHLFVNFILWEAGIKKYWT